tara:strand:+ start:1041 stop:1154 length:114 start_codon:yes stop_codon:yes gene_type:complete
VAILIIYYTIATSDEFLPRPGSGILLVPGFEIADRAL